eukprot:4185717-Amphidinium_carterae.2
MSLAISCKLQQPEQIVFTQQENWLLIFFAYVTDMVGIIDGMSVHRFSNIIYGAGGCKPSIGTPDS